MMKPKETKTAQKPAARVAAKPAAKVEAKKPSRSDDPHAAVRELHERFTHSPPPGSEGGIFHASSATGLVQRVLNTSGKGEPGQERLFDYPLKDGAYRVKGSQWTFAFQGGKLIQAVHEQMKQLIAGKVTEVSAK